jgi:hypothetical protein
MKRRLGLVSLVAMLLFPAGAASVRADDTWAARQTLIGITGVSITVEDLSDASKKMNLAKEDIQTDVELKLRLAGIRVLTEQEGLKLPGNPWLYVLVNVSQDGRAASVEVELYQDAVLTRRGPTWTYSICTWSLSGVMSNPSGPGVRDFTEEVVDRFLNAWLSVNPKK